MDIKNKRKNYKITIVVPTLNEEATLDKVLKSVKKYGDEIIVIDGHSKDNTEKIAIKNKTKFVYDNGRGKGDAIRKSLKIAKHPIVVFIDADGSHEAGDIPKLVQPIREDKADMVVASRMAGGSDELFSDFHQFIRLTGSMIINLCINYRWNIRLSDSQNGYRAILKDVGNHIKLTSNITTIEQEMIMKCLNYGYRVINVPSHEYSRLGGISKVIVSKLWAKYLLNLIKGIFTFSKRKYFIKY